MSSAYLLLSIVTIALLSLSIHYHKPLTDLTERPTSDAHSCQSTLALNAIRLTSSVADVDYVLSSSGEVLHNLSHTANHPCHDFYTRTLREYAGGASNRRLAEGCTSFGACSEIPRIEGCTKHITKSNKTQYICNKGAVIPNPLGLTMNGGGGWLSTNGGFRGFDDLPFSSTTQDIYFCATATGVSKTWRLQTCNRKPNYYACTDAPCC